MVDPLPEDYRIEYNGDSFCIVWYDEEGRINVFSDYATRREALESLMALRKSMTT